MEEDGSSLRILILISPEKRTYVLSVYPTYDNETTSPSNLNVNFQDFFVHYEAVYANASAESSSISIRVDFKSNTFYGVNFVLDYLGEGSVTFRDNGFSRDDDNKIIYNFTIYNPSPGIININYQSQIRPIFLITYQTTSNKCYISGENHMFIIKFFKTSEMEYTHSVIFDTEPNQGLRLQNEGSNEPIYTRDIIYLYQGIFNLYSRISKLSSNDANPIDTSSLYVRIYDDPKLEDNETTTLYIKINQPQFLKLNMGEVENVNEIFLLSSKKTREIKFTLSDCDTINDNIYNCSLTDILVNLDESYISDDYIVEYLSGCDNQRLKINNKKVIIRKGFDLISINPNWVFINDMDTTQITLTYSDIIEEEFNIFYFVKGSKIN